MAIGILGNAPCCFFSVLRLLHVGCAPDYIAFGNLQYGGGGLVACFLCFGLGYVVFRFAWQKLRRYGVAVADLALFGPLAFAGLSLWVAVEVMISGLC